MPHCHAEHPSLVVYIHNMHVEMISLKVNVAYGRRKTSTHSSLADSGHTSSGNLQEDPISPAQPSLPDLEWIGGGVYGLFGDHADI